MSSKQHPVTWTQVESRLAARQLPWMKKYSPLCESTFTDGTARQGRPWITMTLEKPSSCQMASLKQPTLSTCKHMTWPPPSHSTSSPNVQCPCASACSSGQSSHSAGGASPWSHHDISWLMIPGLQNDIQVLLLHGTKKLSFKVTCNMTFCHVASAILPEWWQGT